MNREESMRRHPSGRVLRLVQDAQDQQAIDLANRDHAAVEDWAGGRMRRLNEAHHEASARGSWWVSILGPLGIVAAFFLLMFAVTVLGELAGGWPA